MCIICTGEIYEENFKCLQVLDISHCKIITSEKLQEILIQCKNLEKLRCKYCFSLTSLDLRDNKILTTLLCRDCTQLVSLFIPPNLRELSFFNTLVENVDFSHSRSLTHLAPNESVKSLDLSNCKNLYHLDVSYCRFLTNILLNRVPLDLPSYDCPWISQNDCFSSNLQSLIKLQKWYRRLLIIKYMKSQEFIEWVYAPDNIGGRFHKLKLIKEFKIEI